MRKIIGLVFVVLLVGTSVVAWSRSTASGSHESRHANRVEAFSPDQMHRAVTVPLAEQKYHDMSFVYSVER